jgi:hypothetical protein
MGYIQWNDFWSWSLNFGLPFAPIFLPFWSWLRYTFGGYSKKLLHDDGQANPINNVISIKQDNGKPGVGFSWPNFYYAASQSNYVQLFLFKADIKKLEGVNLRLTLTSLSDQLPDAYQIHRSFIVNPNHIEHLEGNSRKAFVKLKGIEEMIPVSPKRYKQIKTLLQTRPQ